MWRYAVHAALQDELSDTVRSSVKLHCWRCLTVKASYTVEGILLFYLFQSTIYVTLKFNFVRKNKLCRHWFFHSEWLQVQSCQV